MEEIRELVFSMSVIERNAILAEYKNKTPAPMNTQFPDRIPRAEAVENYHKRKQKETAPYPSGGC